MSTKVTSVRVEYLREGTIATKVEQLRRSIVGTTKVINCCWGGIVKIMSRCS